MPFFDLHSGPWLPVLLLLLLLVAALAWWRGSQGAALGRAQAAIDAGDYGRARVWADRAARQAPNELALAAALDVMGGIHRFAGAIPEAETCYRRALAIRQERLPPGDPGIAISLHNVALALIADGRPTEAEPLYRSAVRFLRAAPGERAALALSLGALGQTCMFLGKDDEMEELLKESLRLTEELFTRNHPRTSEALLLLAGGLTFAGRFHPADLAYRESRSVCESLLGSDHPHTLVIEQQHAHLLLGWARLTGDEAARGEAAELAESGLDRARAVLGHEHQATASLHGTLARVRTQQHRSAEAVSLALDAVRISRATFGPDHIRSAYLGLILARALDEAGGTAEAEELARRALAPYERAFGAGHHEVGELYELMGRFAARLGRVEEGEELLRRSLSVREALGRMHPVRGFALQELAALLRRAGRGREADAVDQELAAIVAAAKLPGGAVSRGRGEKVQTTPGQTDITGQGA